MGWQGAGHTLVTEQQPDSVLLRIINKIIHYIKCLPESLAHFKNSIRSSHHFLFTVEHSFEVLAKCSQYSTTHCCVSFLKSSKEMTVNQDNTPGHQTQPQGVKAARNSYCCHGINLIAFSLENPQGLYPAHFY